MQKEMISMRQAVSIIVLFLFGSSVVLGVNTKAGHDSWISMLLAFGLGLVIALVYARLIRLFPGMDFYDICQAVFGKIAGKFIIILMTWYAIHLGALVLRNFSEFVQIVALQETPQLVILVIMLVTTGYLAFSGIETLGKWAIVALILVSIVVVFTLILSIPEIIPSNVLPIMEHDLADINSATLSLFTFPFAETVLFLAIADYLKKEDSPYKIYGYSMLIGLIFLIVVFFRNLMVLGAPIMEESYFPSYTTARIINIGEFLTRIEMSIYYNFILGGIAKITVCIFAAAKGGQKLFNIANGRRMLLPISLLMLTISMVQFDSVMEMMNFIEVYQYYALFFQVVIPVLVWIGAEMKMLKESSLQ